jgi:hypothetical protein
MSDSKRPLPSITSLIPRSRTANVNIDSSPSVLPTPMQIPTPTRTTRPSSPLPRSPISVSRTPVLASKGDFDASVMMAQKPGTPVRVAAPIPEERSVPPSPLPVVMTTYADVVNSTSVESQLEAKKYTILDRIITDEDGVQVHYIKAYDCNGVIVYILMDTIGSVAVKSDELKTMSCMNQSGIPVSDKMSASSCAGTGVCGVALICNEELCMMVRNNDGTTTETSFQSSVPIMNTGSTSVPHIIVRMSEITSDPEGTLNRCYEANERMMRSSYYSAKEAMNRVFEKSEFLLKTVLEDFRKNREAAYNRLEKDRMYLSSWTNKYYTQHVKGNLNSQDEALYISSSDNLYARNKIFLDLISITNTFNKQEDSIEEICNTIISLNNTICEKHEATAKKILTKEEIIKF